MVLFYYKITLISNKIKKMQKRKLNAGYFSKSVELLSQNDEYADMGQEAGIWHLVCLIS